jgi:predicted  nucleic acid-binding Zn-ribbon protein
MDSGNTRLQSVDRSAERTVGGGAIGAVADDLIPILTRFHREVVAPDIERIVGNAAEGAERRLRDEMQTGFGALSRRLEKLEIEFPMLVSGIKRVEERLEALEDRMGSVDRRLDGIDKKLEKMALKSELLELKARVEGLQQQVRALEERLGA